MTTSEISACRDLFLAHANSALFVTSQLRPRELKMADGLRRLGWKVGLIYYEWTPFEPHAYFDACLAVGSAAEAHELAMQLAPRICHVFSGAIDDLVLTFCRQKPSPVVIDLNDVFAPSLFDYCHERFEPTREALALADGFCARDLQVKSAEHADGFKLPQRLIFFPEYGWNTESLADRIAEREASDEVHVVSVGTFSLETQGMYDSCYLQLTKMMTGQGIHFHIYPHWAYRRDHSGSPHAKFEKDFAEFIALQEQNPYLHLHDSLPIDELAKVLPRYDFGLVSGGAPEFGQKLGFYYPAYLDTCYSGRISDYLDARLPVLINEEVKFDYWLLKRYGIGIDLKGVLAPGFREKLLALKRDPRQRQAMDHAVQALSVTANAPRLAAYYQGLMAAAGTVAVDASQDTEAQPLAVAEPIAADGAAPAPPAVVQAVPSTGDWAATLKAKIRWASPRLAKIILPYRAIRIFEYRLHNALQELQANAGVIAGLNARVGSLQQETDRSRESLEALEHSNAGLVSELAASAQANEALSADRTALQQANASLAADVAALRREMDSQATEVAALRQEAHSHRIQISRLEDDRTALNIAAAESHQAKAKLLAELARSREQGNVLGAQVSALEAERLATSARLGGLESDKAHLSAALAKLQTANEDLGAKAYESARLALDLAALEKEKDGLISELVAVRQENLGQRNRIAGLESEHAELRIAAAESHQAKSALLAELSRSERKYAELGDRMIRLDEERLAASKCIGGLESDKAQLTAALAKLQAANEDLGAKLLDLEQAKAALNASMNRLQTDKEVANARLMALDAAMTRVQDEKAALMIEIEKVGADRTAVSVHADQLRLENASLTSQLASLGQTCKLQRDELAALQARLQELGSDNAGLKLQLPYLQADIAESKGQARLLMDENRTLAAHASQVSTDNSSLRAANAQIAIEASQASARAETLGQQLGTVQAQLATFTGRTEQQWLVSSANRLSAKLSDAIHGSDDADIVIDSEPKLLLACMPKSGSTWLTTILEQQLRLEPMRAYLQADRNEQEIDPMVLVQAMGRRALFIQQHIRFSRVLLRLCRAFATRIVVLTRRLDDVVVSLRDHILTESAEFSMFYMERDWFQSLGDKEQLDFLIDHAMPWYLNFQIGWQRAATANPGRILHVRYEEMVANLSACVQRIATFHGCDVSAAADLPMDLRDGTRFNQGRVGRGAEVLNKAQIARLTKLASYYAKTVPTMFDTPPLKATGAKR